MKLNERCVAEFSTSSAPIDKEGYLNKKGELNRGYQRRWFILKGNLLYYFEKRSDKEPIGVIVLDNCHVEMAESGEPYAFQITFGGDGSRTYILGADTPKEMESWMRAVTHSNYDCLRVMVESFESTLKKLSSEENDLVGVSSSRASTSRTDTASGGFLSDFDMEQRHHRSSTVPAHERPVSKVARDSSVRYNDKLGGFETLRQKGVDEVNAEETVSNEKSTRPETIGRTQPVFGNLIDFEDDDQLPMHSEFSFNEGFYSIAKHSEDLMPLSYSDLERLEGIHSEDFFNRLSGNVPRQSKDDSALISRSRPSSVSRNQRTRSERKRNNVKLYNVLDPGSNEMGNSRTLERSLYLSDDVGYVLENRSVFRYLHELYSASIWVKCKEFGKQDVTKQ